MSDFVGTPPRSALSVRLRRLQLKNHRNYVQLDLAPGPGVNVFIGANGHGKTNLLEAVAMLALSSSPRARRELELVGPAGSGSRIQAEIDDGPARREISISLDVEGQRARRTIEVDGVRRRAIDLPGHFRVVLFWPDDLGLVKAGPELRRRFLNQMLVQVEPGYARALAGLRRVLEQRNSLLKRIASGEGGDDMLHAWNQELVQVGGEIVAARARAVRELEPEAARCHAEIAPGERLEIHYEGPPENLAEAVNNSLAEDLKRGSTSVGPHRDDVPVLLDGQEARSYASQGQQRTAVVSLKLAEAALIENRTGERPLLLLDDVLSELDGERRAALLKEVAGGGQVIITSVEAGPFPPELMAGAMVWTVIEGKIQACG
ncbi:MAG: DNA replication/repair protein RecF [Chloroflexi bacterium]|nr:MAG: DNA replication/repair protein RecF [Chloroflexota bacterium]TMF76884.1 MAG: DNA replication/repair protein RecF [Chloroflexota bacterium]TMF79242.1 MAG: DNA replication/repair protein RecF [Chloroflexota bacterium]TMF91590.1 MAG: DNA replication/repair protein RecF [Chloroflexota bacterium]TMG46410.1 MAG: DNA replication/repair protein RecF [Chloroflexota bacterium]